MTNYKWVSGVSALVLLLTPMAYAGDESIAACAKATEADVGYPIENHTKIKGDSMLSGLINFRGKLGLLLFADGKAYFQPSCLTREQKDLRDDCKVHVRLPGRKALRFGLNGSNQAHYVSLDDAPAHPTFAETVEAAATPPMVTLTEAELTEILRERIKASVAKIRSDTLSRWAQDRFNHELERSLLPQLQDMDLRKVSNDLHLAEKLENERRENSERANKTQALQNEVKHAEQKLDQLTSRELSLLRAGEHAKADEIRSKRDQLAAKIKIGNRKIQDLSPSSFVADHIAQPSAKDKRALIHFEGRIEHLKAIGEGVDRLVTQERRKNSAYAASYERGLAICSRYAFATGDKVLFDVVSTAIKESKTFGESEPWLKAALSQRIDPRRSKFLQPSINIGHIRDLSKSGSAQAESE